MTEPNATASTPPADQPESYARIVVRPLAVLGLLAALACYHARVRLSPAPPDIPPARAIARPRPPTPVALPPAPGPPASVAEVFPIPVASPRPGPTLAPTLDRAAVARGEAAVDAASSERAHAEARLADAERALQVATLQAANELAAGKKIGATVRDPSARIAAASTRGGFLKGERDRLKHELAALERIPQARPHPLMAKGAVAKPTEGAEYHFEVRRSRVTWVDLDRLVDMVKADAKLRLRAGGPRGRLSASVGPVGSFMLRYEMGRSVPEALAEMLGQGSVTYNLLGWELVPESPNRGETIEATRTSSSNYARAIRRLHPGHDTITMWIYPDGFAMYRQLRDDLHAQGFLVAARPLPEGTTIKGSPSGSLSAGQ